LVLPKHSKQIINNKKLVGKTHNSLTGFVGVIYENEEWVLTDIIYSYKDALDFPLDI
jgi:hypothetical protein